MEIDERIETTLNRVGARGFFIWFALTLISLNYRLWILKQNPREFWDFIAIFYVANLFVFIAYSNKGVFAHNFKRYWLAIFTVVFIASFTLSFIMGEIHSVVDVGEKVIGLLLGAGLVIAIAYFLNWRWKRKEGIEDET